MNQRENLLRALRRDNPERVPFDFNLCPSQVDNFEKRTGTRDYRKYYGFPTRNVILKPTRKVYDYSKYYQGVEEKLEPLNWNPEWGIMGIRGSVAHFQKMVHPLENFNKISDIEEYPFPDMTADYRWEGLKEENENFIRQGFATIGEMQMTIFELCWYLRGMDNFMIDFYENPEYNDALMDKITDIRIVMARKYAEVGVDILQLGDDVSTQRDMMMAPELWAKTLKPRMAKIIQAAKEVKPDILVFYHGDGNLEKIIPDLIEIGVDVLNPVQPECVDPFKVKKLYGDRLSFWGCVGTQTTMPFGTKEEIFDVCRRLIQEVGKGGGLLLAPTHTIEPEVPYENVEAFLEAVDKFGKY
ncbi:MAG: uroporphyrinogen decarboxylase family protein [Lachnospiraceae bacterium]|jgi:uroporphyrinogen decarboxylase